MGVPTLFRWLSRKYPKIVTSVQEEDEIEVLDTLGKSIKPVDITGANPNGVEFHNFYLDMNCIIHPCTHPEDKPPPETEEEMMAEVLKYTNRVVNAVRPRKLLFMAVDGVAPRAKMNQQRSRRFFRSTQNAKDKGEAGKLALAELEATGKVVSDEEKHNETWDSNAITPGTPFMDLLAASLRYWVVEKINSDPGWKDLQVIISDASVPGEGEHKVMDFIRRQRSNPGHDPNTSHVIYGSDSDLLMLALATHEPYFRILREGVLAQDSSTACRTCGEEGHFAIRCPGLKPNSIVKKSKLLPDKKPLIFLDVSILREYLETDLDVPRVPFPFDFEQAIDDWVLLIFFVGNDFLPHLPSLEIREDAIDTLLNIWKMELPRMGGYLTDHGKLVLERAEIILEGLARREDGIFKKRQEAENRHDYESKRRRINNYKNGNDVPGISSAADPSPGFTGPVYNSSVEQTDSVRLHEPGYKDRYYQQKFSRPGSDIEFRKMLTQYYVEGIAWVLHYYYQGTPSWQWYYPFHFAPFASDFEDLKDMKINFTIGRPFKPYEQLMGVLPPASKKHIPAVFHDLMTEPTSPIIDFYPTSFQVDMNGKKMMWQGVTLLPFIDEKRLLDAMSERYSLLTDDEVRRDSWGSNAMYVSDEHRLYSFFGSLYGKRKDGQQPVLMPVKDSKGINGTVLPNPDCIPGSTFYSPLTAIDLPDIKGNRSLSALYFFPEQLTPHRSMLLPGLRKPRPQLSPEDIARLV